MRDFPHCYAISAVASPAGDVQLDGPSLPSLVSAPPAEFDGPGDRWSPETLLVAAVADCFVLTFRGFAKASKLEWQTLTCGATGTLDRADGVTQFTGFTVTASLQLPDGGDEDRARRVLERAEHACLVANSLKGRCQFAGEVHVVRAARESAAMSVSVLDEQC
jgi:organic hydroperoxide reductase OsmC/OhrA